VKDHAQRSPRERPPQQAKGVTLTPLKCAIDASGYHYEYVDAVIDRAARSATLTVSGRNTPNPIRSTASSKPASLVAAADGASG